MKNISSTDNIRTIALTNILAAQKVIKYNQQFLRSEDIADAEKRLLEIEKYIRSAIADCEEIKLRSIEFRDKCDLNSFDRNEYNHDIYDREKMLIAYNHCLRIITSEQNIF